MTPMMTLRKVMLSFAALGLTAATAASFAPVFGQYYYNNTCPDGYYYDPSYGCQPSAESDASPDYSSPDYGYADSPSDYGYSDPGYGYGTYPGYGYGPGYAAPGVGFGFGFSTGGGERFHHRGSGSGTSVPRGVASGGASAGGSHAHQRRDNERHQR